MRTTTRHRILEYLGGIETLDQLITFQLEFMILEYLGGIETR